MSLIAFIIAGATVLDAFDGTDSIPDNLRPWAIVVGLVVMAGCAAYELINRWMDRDHITIHNHPKDDA